MKNVGIRLYCISLSFAVSWVSDQGCR